MRLTKNYLRKLILEEVGLLLEAEPEEEAEEETEEEPEEEAEEETEEEPEGEAEEEPEVHVTPEEGVELGKSADDQITAFLVDYESKAIKSAVLTQDSELRHDPEQGIDVESLEMSEVHNHSLSDLLFEEEQASIAGMGQWVGSPDIDVESFTNDVARLIMNYDSLVDMEALIINRAHAYILDKYDQETASYFEELLNDRHSMTRESSHDDDEPDPEIYAVGALAQGTGGA